MADFLSTYGFLIIQMMFAAMLGLSLYLPLMTGQLSLASPGFYALGGYVAAIMSTQVFTLEEGQAFPIAYVLIEMGVAAALCAVVAVIVGIAALRLRGIYLALATIAFVEILRVTSLNLDITGGATGIFGIPQPLGASQKLEYLVFAGPMLLLCIFFMYRLERTRVGRAFSAIREDELAAAAMGINVTFHKVLAFTMGAVLAGLVGAVSAHFLNTWNARQGTFDAAILYLAFVIVGGSRTFAGPILGGLLLTALPEALRAIAGNADDAFSVFLRDGRLIIFGVLIAVGTLFFPQGLITPDIFNRGRKKKRGLTQPVEPVQSVREAPNP
ncbi:MAG: branched-chain amino acid ABC transporter permease [bacterium]|nr:branched-chain amino acid ABC transporter permease [bacterium]